MPNSRRAILSAGFLALAITAIESAENLPNFDVGPTCRGATRPEAALRDKTADAARNICFSKENQARDELKEKWVAFPLEHRASCVRTTSVGGIPSYVQLQSCLETRRDAARMKNGRDKASTTGQGAPQ
jgi:hypothetical protein